MNGKIENEIDTSEFAEAKSRGAIVGERGRDGGVEPAKMFSLSTYPDARPPDPPVEIFADTFESRTIVRRAPAIHGVLAGRRGAQVAASVVESVAIAVIDHSSDPHASTDDLMELAKAATSILVSAMRVPNASPWRHVRRPSERRQIGVQVVDIGHSSLRAIDLDHVELQGPGTRRHRPRRAPMTG